MENDLAEDSLLGQTLDEKYLIEERLGEGGMGAVYRARHLLMERPVAIKVLHPDLVEDEPARIRFQREARAAVRLQHQNAVAVSDFGETAGGYVYIVMELLEGHTLREVLAREAPIETARAISIMLQAAAGVGAAHEAGIIHRDLKPANIIVTQGPDVPVTVKVVDFGLAKLVADTLDDEDGAITLRHGLIGTPRYMAPEQYNGDELTPAADVYSLGVILYEMLTGMAPFTGSSPVEIAAKHVSQAPHSPRAIVAAIPDEVEQVVLHALEKHPAKRPANGAEFHRELLDTAQRLGLEHHALKSVPDIEALRGEGVESPSGRLVVDIARVRALSSGSNEIKVVGDKTRVNRAKPGKRGSFLDKVKRILGKK